MHENIEVLNHSCVKIIGSKVIYVDPYGLKNKFNDADYIFITHSHYDHFSEADIEMVRKDSTKIIITNDLYDKVISLGFAEEDITAVEPYEEYKINDIEFKTVIAYNKLKPFHTKDKGWVGYIIKRNGISYYITGDTDFTPEMLEVKCDVAFVPVGGTYTMNASEAAEFVNAIKPNLAIPIHYGSIVGTNDDAKDFISLVNDVECKILM